MRLLGFGLGSLVAVFGLALGCGENEGNKNGSGGAGEAAMAGKTASDGTAGSASEAGRDAGGHASGGSSGQTTGGAKPTAGESQGGAAPVAGTASDGGDASGGGAPNMSGDLIACDARKVFCRVATPQCAEGEVASVVGTCWGKCVKIAECACSNADECPLPDKYTCWMKSHCGPFVR